MPITGFKTTDFIRPIEIKPTGENRGNSVEKDAFETTRPKTLRDLLSPHLSAKDIEKTLGLLQKYAEKDPESSNSLRILFDIKGVRFDSITDDPKEVTKALNRASSEPRTSEPRVVFFLDSKAGNLTTVHQDPKTKEVKISNPAGKTEGCAELETLLHE
ncbi:MAG: hypothetical protein WCK42_08450, partial [Myxococcaceae bacterium]